MDVWRIFQGPLPGKSLRFWPRERSSHPLVLAVEGECTLDVDDQWWLMIITFYFTSNVLSAFANDFAQSRVAVQILLQFLPIHDKNSFPHQDLAVGWRIFILVRSCALYPEQWCPSCAAEALCSSESPEWSSAKTFIFLSELACNRPYEADLKLLAKKTDSCRKLWYGHPTLSPGIFTIYCQHGVCYGYEVMAQCESPKIPFHADFFHSLSPTTSCGCLW